jgi:preprotein translocase subunit SecE
MQNREQLEARQENRFQRWYRETRAELSKVSWPTRQEGLRLTGIVLVVTVISAIVIFGIDSLFSTVIGAILQAF